MFPIWLLLVTLVLVLLATSALYRVLMSRTRRQRDKAQILKRVAELEDHRRSS